MKKVSIEICDAEIAALREFRERYEYFQALPLSQYLKTISPGTETILRKVSEVALDTDEIHNIRAKARERASMVKVAK